MPTVRGPRRRLVHRREHRLRDRHRRRPALHRPTAASAGPRSTRAPSRASSAVYASDKDTAMLFTSRGIFRSTRASDTSVPGDDLRGGRELEAPEDGVPRLRPCRQRAVRVGHDGDLGLDEQGRVVEGGRQPADAEDKKGKIQNITRYVRVDFVSAKVGYAVTTGGRVWKTTNGGKKWSELDLGRHQRDLRPVVRRREQRLPDDRAVPGHRDERSRAAHDRRWQDVAAAADLGGPDPADRDAGARTPRSRSPASPTCSPPPPAAIRAGRPR